METHRATALSNQHNFAQIDYITEFLKEHPNDPEGKNQRLSQRGSKLNYIPVQMNGK